MKKIKFTKTEWLWIVLAILTFLAGFIIGSETSYSKYEKMHAQNKAAGLEEVNEVVDAIDKQAALQEVRNQAGQEQQVRQAQPEPSPAQEPRESIYANIEKHPANGHITTYTARDVYKEMSTNIDGMVKATLTTDITLSLMPDGSAELHLRRHCKLWNDDETNTDRHYVGNWRTHLYETGGKLKEMVICEQLTDEQGNAITAGVGIDEKYIYASERQQSTAWLRVIEGIRDALQKDRYKIGNVKRI